MIAAREKDQGEALIIARSATGEFAVQVVEIYLKRVLSHVRKGKDEHPPIHSRDPGRPLLPKCVPADTTGWQQPVATPGRGFQAHTAAGNKPRPVVLILLESSIHYGLPRPSVADRHRSASLLYYDG